MNNPRGMVQAGVLLAIARFDGTMLNTIVTEAKTSSPPLLIAHGLFGSARNWGAVARRLSQTRQVITVDMRNHGASPHFPTHGYHDLAADLGAVAEEFGATAVMGHSMGGKAAMVLALTRPELVDRLIVVDIAPVTYSHTQLPVLEALRQVDLSQISRRSDADLQLAAHIDDPALRAFLLQSLAMGEDGARWRLNLDTLTEQMAQIMGFPQIEARFDGRIDFVNGARSDYVTDTGWQAAQKLFPNAQRHMVAGAGHWVHAEAFKDFTALVSDLLEN